MSSDWFTAGNWQGGTLPGAGEIVDIDMATPNETVVDGAAAGGPKATVGRTVIGRASTGVLTIRNGGIVESVVGPSGVNEIGQGINPQSQGTVAVTGPGSLWSMNGGLAVNHGTLAIENGGRVTAIGTTNGVVTIDLGGKATVTSADSRLETNDILEVGVQGQGTLTIAGGGVVTSASGVVGDTPNSTGAVTVTGPGSGWSMNDGLGDDPPPGTLIIGAEGIGTVTVADGGVVSASGPVNIGQMAGSMGTLNIGAAAGQTAAAPGDLQAPTAAFGAGTGTINFNHTSSSYTFAPAISGAGSVNQLAGTTILTAASTYTGPTTINGGTLLVNGSILFSNVTVNGGGTLGGIGVVGPTTVHAGGTVAPGSPIGTLTAAGNVTFQQGSIYQTDITPQGQSDLLQATGTATLNGGNVNVISAGGIYRPGTRYTILHADGGVTGGFSSLTDTLPLLDLTLVSDPNNVYLDVARNAVPIHHLAVTDNQRNTGQVVQNLGPGHPVHDAVVSVPDEAAARQAFHALSGEMHASVSGVLVNDSRYVRSAVLGRLRQVPYAGEGGPLAALGIGGPALAYQPSPQEAYAADFPVKAPPPGAPPRPASGLTFWAQGFGAWGSFDGDGNAAGVNRSLGGALVGLDSTFDGALADRWRVGFAAGYSQADVNIGDRASRATVDSGHVALYGGGSFGAWNLRGGLAYAHHQIDTSRWIMFPGFVDRATADYSGGTGQVFGELGYGVNFGRVAVEPFAGLAWVHVKTNSFTEGDGAAALMGSSVTEETGYSTLGARFATTFALINGMALTPRASFAWQHAFNDVTPEAALAFLQNPGVGFGISGVPLARDSALVEAGLDLQVMPQMTLGVSYLGQLASSTEDHAVKGQFTWRF